MDLDLAGLARMRLSEHAIHSWDVAGGARPGVAGGTQRGGPDRGHARPAPARSGKPDGTKLRLHVSASGPQRNFTLESGETVTALVPSAAGRTPGSRSCSFRPRPRPAGLRASRIPPTPRPSRPRGRSRRAAADLPRLLNRYGPRAKGSPCGFPSRRVTSPPASPPAADILHSGLEKWARRRSPRQGPARRGVQRLPGAPAHPAGALRCASSPPARSRSGRPCSSRSCRTPWPGRR